MEEFEGAREISLSLSCIRAAQIILGCQEPVRFLTKEKEGREEDFGNFDFFLYTKLEDSREKMFEILQNRQLNLKIRMLMVLSMTHDIQRRISQECLFEVDNLLERYGKQGAAARFERQVEGMAFGAERRFAAMDKLVEILDGMEVLNPAWKPELKKLRQALCGEGPGRYKMLREEFGQWLESSHELNWDVCSEQLMVYFVFTYYCGAVYDLRAYTRMKFAVCSTLMIQELAFGRWLCNGKKLSFEDFADVAHCFSREVEHSDLNKNLLMDRLEEQWDYRMETLAGMIL